MFVASLERVRRLAAVAIAGAVLAFPAAVQAQEAMSITGQVTDETGEPLANVNIYIDGSDLAAFTGMAGRYSLVVPASRVDGLQRTLIAGLIGYRSAAATITLAGGALTQDFSLELDPIGLEEIIAVGQGLTSQKRKLGVTVNSISSQDIEDSQERTIVSAIAGKAPNVLVTQSSGDPGAGTYINIRGFKSIQGGSQPLIVVDGTPVFNAAGESTSGNSNRIEGATRGTAFQNRAADINPDDIASIEILKGPAGTAIYGSNGANGVILITTKQGSASELQANIRVAYTLDDVTAFNDLQTTFGQGLGGEFVAASQSWGPRLDAGTQVFAHGDEMFQQGNSIDANLTLAGGNNSTTYFFSGGYLGQSGVIRGNSKLDRGNIRMKASQRFLSNLEVTGNFAYTKQQADLVQQGSNTSGMLLGAFRTPPEFNNIPWIDPESGFQRSYRCETGVQGAACRFTATASRGYDNPFWISNEILNTADVDRTFGNIRIDWDPFSWLNVSELFGVDFSNDDRFTLFPKSSSNVPSGRVERASLNNFSLDNTLLLTANADLSSSILGQLTVGQNIRQVEFSRLQTRGDNLIFGAEDLESTVTRIPTEFESRVRTVGYFAEANIDIGDQLFLTGGVRYDGFSTFGSDQQWFWFPNGSAAWEFTQLLGDGGGAFDYGKVRVAYGQAGTDPPVFSNLAAFQTTTFSDGWISPLGLESIYLGQEGVVTEFSGGNEFINPEITTEYEAGVDLAFVNSRIQLSGVYFYQKTTDAILELPVPPSTGFEDRPVNGAEFQNQGIELQLGVVPFRGRQFSWEIDVHGGHMKSEVLELLDAEEFFLDGFTSGGTVVTKDICGPSADEPCQFGVLRGDDMKRFGRGLSADIDCNGVGGESIDAAFPSAAAGSFYIACDGFPESDPRQRVFGDPNPLWNGGVRNTFTIMENLRISALIDWRTNVDMQNGTKGALFFFGTHADTESWHLEGQPFTFEGDGPGAGNVVRLDEEWARIRNGSLFTGGTVFFIERANFVKLRDVSVKYTIGGGAVARFLGFNRAELTFAGRNLITWTNYGGLDPESNLTGQSTGRGLEYFNNPRIRSYVFQINLVH